MQITADMSLTRLARRMGEGTTEDAASRMRDLLISRGHADQDTRNVPAADWQGMLNEAAPPAVPTWVVPFTRTLSFTLGDLSSVLCTAFEGGIGYWARYHGSIPQDHRPDQFKHLGLDHYCAYDSCLVGGVTTVYDVEDGKKEHDLTIERLIKGLTWALNGGIEGLSASEDAEDMTGRIDADDADAIVQYALFGEVVYG